MGIDNGNQMLFKMKNVVAQELHIMLDHISKSTTDTATTTAAAADTDESISTKYIIDCDVSYLIHMLSHSKTCHNYKY